ncbi:MAG TPA: IPT/TIG domain-containing protein [Bryobacteraceae bacterium]|nr:IPT/TIG domain-containing protein [Bryobacteraceae bacterium]
MRLRTAFVSIGGLAAFAVFGRQPLCFAQGATGTINTIAGNGDLGFGGDGGPAISAKISAPDGLALDKSGNLFIVDNGNNRIRKVDKSGLITTFAGNGSSGFAGDGGPATSAEFAWGFNGHLGIGVDSSGNLYIADLSNQRVRMVDSQGIIRTVAGNGNRDNTGDGGPATSAGLVDPIAVAIDRHGNLFIAEFAGNRVRKVDTSGTITTAAGGGPLSGNGDGGPATNAVLNAPWALAFDGAGNLYIGDVTARRVRKVDTSGIITTLAGNGSTTDSGDGGPATQAGFSLTGLAADSAGNVFISESSNRIRQVNTSGIINTIAGTGTGGYSGDGGPAISANLNSPGDVLVDSSGNLYIADFFNNRVREVAGVTQSSIPSVAAGGVVSASAFGEFTSISPGSWIEIYGSNLAPDTRGWAGSDFSGVNAPTSLDGTSVTIGGQAAFVSFISQGQVNVLAPSGISAGSQQLVVTTAAGVSNSYTVNVNAVEPGLIAPAAFIVGGKQYVAALFPDYATFAIPTGAIAHVTSRPAKPGDILIIYGIGFGDVAPSIPAGQLVQAQNTLTAPFDIYFGNVKAAWAYAGLAPGYTGLYQFNVTVPAVPASDLVPLTFTLNGTPGTQTLYVAVQAGS